MGIDQVVEEKPVVDVTEKKAVIDVTERYIGSSHTDPSQKERPVIDDATAKQRMRKMELITAKYNTVVKQMQQEDISQLGLKQKVLHHLKKKQTPSLEELFGNRIGKMREYADMLNESVKECTANKQDILKNMNLSGEQLEALTQEYRGIRHDVGIMETERSALIAKGVVPRGFGKESLRLYTVEDAMEMAARDAKIVGNLHDGVKKYFDFYDFHMKLYNEMVALGRQAFRDVQLHTEKLEQLVQYIENPEKVVENFLKVYHTLKSTSEYMDKIYSCLMGYTKIISNIGLPGIVSNRTYDSMKETTTDMKKRSEEFTKGYKGTMTQLDEKILGEKQEMLKEVKQAA